MRVLVEAVYRHEGERKVMQGQIEDRDGEPIFVVRNFTIEPQEMPEGYVIRPKRIFRNNTEMRLEQSHVDLLKRARTTGYNIEFEDSQDEAVLRRQVEELRNMFIEKAEKIPLQGPDYFEDGRPPLNKSGWYCKVATNPEAEVARHEDEGTVWVYMGKDYEEAKTAIARMV